MGVIAMSVSYAEQVNLTCPICIAVFKVEVWLIIAAEERPDLIKRINAGSLHRLVCSQCGQASEFDMPVLLFQPAVTPPILFSPTQEVTNRQAQQQAVDLIGLLRERLG